MKARLLFFIPAFVYTLGILYLSLINLTDTPVKDLGVSDKVMHAGAYFGLGFIWMFFALMNYPEKGFFKRLLFIIIASIIFGIFIEVLQDSLTTYRELDFYDIFANSIGVLAAGILVWLIKDSLIRLKAKINLFFIKK
ncbi:VanZ family protein [Salinimicrobium flavum]|uniref:VanZ family protein n=1 Tax=Salinimicrobium flavum TaxID=1737065 RepID=A0ABW5IWB8_9FLAO